jgi:hypothetical protein
MSLTPPPFSSASKDDVWVDPITADRWGFTGDETKGTYGWVNVGPNVDYEWKLDATPSEDTR